MKLRRPLQDEALKKIYIKSVCRQLFSRNFEKIEAATARECPIMPYTFKEFEADMMADDFIASGTTVTAKWKSLQASGIIVEQGTKTFVNIDELRAKCDYARGAAA